MEMRENEKGGPAGVAGEKAAKGKGISLKAKVGLGVGCALVVVGIGGGIAIAAQHDPEPAQPATAEQAAEPQKQEAAIEVGLGDWDAESSTPLIAHITGDGVDLYTALDEQGRARVELSPGDYEVEFVPSIGADGSLLKVPGKLKLSVKDSGGSFTAVPEKTDAADVPKEELSAVIEQIAAAVKGGDSSLKGEAGKKLLETAKANAAANPNMDDAAKADAEAKAAEGEKAADEPAKNEGAAASSNGAAGSTAQAAPSSSGSGSGGSSSGGSSSGASSAPSQPAHVHSWVAVTTQQWHSNPVTTQVWVQDSAAWDEPIYSGTYWCNTCGCAVSVNHVKETMMAGQGHSVTTKNIQTGTVHHDATGHYESHTEDQGWYETVTTGYQCSYCGAWQ